MRPDRRQAGFILSMEVLYWIVPVMTLALLLFDLSRVVNHRSQMESAAFSLVMMVANRSGYQQRYEPDTPQPGDNYFLELDQREPADQQAEFRGLQSAAELLLDPTADVGLVLRQINDVTGIGVTYGSGCQASLPPIQDDAVYPIYVIWLCDRRSWTWLSSGLWGSLLSGADGVFVARALMPSRNMNQP